MDRLALATLLLGDDISNITSVCKEIRNELPSFQAKSKVLIGDGKMTAFGSIFGKNNKSYQKPSLLFLATL